MGLVFVFINNSIESDFLISFLKKDLITILIALLAINTTTSSVIMTKLKEISDKNKIDFSSTVAELKHSTIEQVAYIVLSIVNMMLMGSKYVTKHFTNY